MLNLVAGIAVDLRANARSNVFLTATLVASGVSLPVRVRNISQRGALLDGLNLPVEGSSVHLRRGSLSTEGEVAWRDDEQCGVWFNTAVVVKDWVRRLEHTGQQRVDEMLRLARQSFKLSTDGLARVSTQSEDTLRAISTDLTQACEGLANNHSFVTAQADELLKLDAVAQRLRRLVESTDGKT